MLLLPVLVNTVTLLAVGSGHSLTAVAVVGFSGVVAGFAGFVLAALWVHLADVGDANVAWAGTGFALAALALVPVRSTGLDGAVTVVIAGIAVATFVVAGLGLGAHVDQFDLDGVVSISVELATLLCVGAIVAWFASTVVPLETASTRTTVEATGHWSGMGLGFLVALVTERATRTGDSLTLVPVDPPFVGEY